MISFNLPEERSEYMDCVNASKMFSVLWEICQDCRSVLKYGHKFESVDEYADHIRDMIPYELFEE